MLVRFYRCVASDITKTHNLTENMLILWELQFFSTKIPEAYGVGVIDVIIIPKI